VNAAEAPCERFFHLRTVMTILIDDSSLRYGPSANLEVHPTVSSGVGMGLLASASGGHGPLCAL